MGEGTNFLSHLNVLNGLITQLANLGVKIEDEDKAIVLINSLPSSYDTLATTILHGKDSIELKDCHDPNRVATGTHTYPPM